MTDEIIVVQELKDALEIISDLEDGTNTFTWKERCSLVESIEDAIRDAINLLEQH